MSQQAIHRFSKHLGYSNSWLYITCHWEGPVNHHDAKQDATSNSTSPVYDVTEYKRREEELRNQIQELEQLNEQLAARNERNTRILAGMSHEIRTPMHAIMAFAELMEQEILGPLTDKQRDALGNVRQAGEHLMTMLNDVIDLHRAEVGKVELHPRPVAVEELIDAAYHIVHGLAWEKQIRVRVSIEPEGIVVNADEQRAKQVLHNLLSNAINASPAGEEITIQARKTSREALISVIDHGPGIPAEYHERIFEEFIQYNNGAQSVPSGGLGLPVSRNLVELHGGELTISSEVGKGSTFTFTLPLAEENPDQ